MTAHYVDPYLRNPGHKITIDLAGVGGTGSQMITGLARISEALKSMGHPGLHVRAWDDDIVTEANVGRQLFSTSDIGFNKAFVLITRVNRFFGFEWEAMNETFGGQRSSNITISCIDTAMGRVMLGMKIEGKSKARQQPYDKRYYWMDVGNLQKTGQVILGTISPVKQPTVSHKTKAVLKTVSKKFPQLKTIRDDLLGPSCSLAEALNKQDLFINSTIAQFGCNLLWKLIREGMITYHGCFINLENCIVNPIKIN